MTIEDKIKDEKLQYDINREATKISALSSGKIDKYEYLTGEEILPSNQQQIIEQAKFTYSSLGKALKNKQKLLKIEEKQIDALIALKPKNDAKVKLDQTPSISNNYFKDRLDEINKYYKPIDKGDLEIYDNKNTALINFLHYKDPISLFYDITDNHKTLEYAKYEQKSFKNMIKDLKDCNIPYSEKYKINKLKIYIIQEIVLLKFLMIII